MSKYPDKRLIICTKEYTSKTCKQCRYVKNNLGEDKKFKCNKCGLIVDREANRARNILLKLLSQ
ncbi:14170_t:CDS:1, partial [Cetraspora pellucida]